MKKDCESVQSELSAYIDNELPPTERTVVENHLSDCPHCRGELEKLKTLVAGVTALPRLEPRPQFLAEVRRKVAREEKPQWKAWQDHFFRPFWLKVPLEAAAVLVIVALMMRVERPAGERALKYEARKEVGQEKVTTLAANESQSMGKPVSSRPIGGAIDERSQPPTPSAPVLAARSASTGELSQKKPTVVVVAHANDFNDVQNHAQRFAAALNGRVVPPPNREVAAQTVFVELPQENVALFRSRLLQATEPTRAEDTHLLAAESGTAPRTAPLSGATTGIGANVLTGKAGTNLIAVGGSERLRAAGEPKAATVVLEIQVVPPTN